MDLPFVLQTLTKRPIADRGRMKVLSTGLSQGQTQRKRGDGTQFRQRPPPALNTLYCVSFTLSFLALLVPLSLTERRMPA
ncbi:hypothetical protein AOXY_G5552 [Acipenser oxyrinchus oxyrinchus]|uniref:Uncharacterized protein n=1 Tax=Acipenser oxyrinchus oxyrinchus TaxID=40147 RepID=A0AAD8GEL7_ACIOX|nr:hypothetical protein AOXY_G5552 [Acipenser oxyrinchus oxyrinchus]